MATNGTHHRGEGQRPVANRQIVVTSQRGATVPSDPARVNGDLIRVRLKQKGL